MYQTWKFGKVIYKTPFTDPVTIGVPHFVKSLHSLITHLLAERSFGCETSDAAKRFNSCLSNCANNKF